MTRRRLTIALLMGFAALAGCATKAITIADSTWKLSAWTLSSMQASEFDITARFADGTLSGSSAVNRYTGPYSLGPGKQLAVGNLASTRMAGPERAMRAEAAYLTLLGKVRGHRMDDGQLTLLDQAGNVTLVFERAPTQ